MLVFVATVHLLFCTSIGCGGEGLVLICVFFFVLLLQCGIIDSEHEGFVSVIASRVQAKGTSS